uniref:Uncharacterized protein n=1 Tax=Davidia involucrata TaxID=16924 RepID=A0A5B6YJ96_DAVIN
MGTIKKDMNGKHELLFETLCELRQEEDSQVHESLQGIPDRNIARRTCILQQNEEIEDPHKQHQYFLVEMEGINLEDFVKSEENKRKFFHYDKDRKVYAISDLYITLLRALINGIKVLRKKKFTASLDLKDIYIVTGDSPRFGLTKRVKRDVSKGNDDHDDWKNLAKALVDLNEKLKVEPCCQILQYLIQTFEHPEKRKLDQVLEHPIFWEWRRRKDFIIHLADFLQAHKINICDHDVDIAFKDWEIFFEGNTNLKLLKKQTTIYKNKKIKKIKKNDGDKNIAEEVVVGNRQRDRNNEIKEWICFMRNTYCHFFEKKLSILQDIKDKEMEEDKEEAFEIKDNKEMEECFYQNFPTIVYALAVKVARLEARINKWENCVWPKHI